LKLPDNILAGLNLSVSRHQNPEALDWQYIGDKWVAADDDRNFLILYDARFGFVIAETKSITYGLGADIK